MAWYAPLNPTTSKVRISLRKLFGVPNQTGRSIYPSGWTRLSGMILWNGVVLAATGPPDPHQPQGVRIEDVEVAASIHQHLGEPRVADDPVDNQRVMAWVGMRFGRSSQLKVMASPDHSRKEGGEPSPQ
jgi:hypothetical protein